MTVLELEDKRVSINHAELWGHTADGRCFYIRLRPSLSTDLTIRISDEFEEKGYISKDSTFVGLGEQYEKSYDFKNYQDAKQTFENGNDLLEDTPYRFEDGNVPKL